MRTPAAAGVVLLTLLTAAGVQRAAADRGTIIEDFESGTVTLESYPGQDQEPSAWELDSQNTFGGSAYALRIFGNSWKIEPIAPYSVADTTVWQVAVFIERLGEMQAFGVTDGQNELLYTFAGEHLPEEPKWWTVYQGAFPVEEWYAYLLPIGEDWYATYGYLPTLTGLIYVNDDDDGPAGATLFDEIIDVTEDLPVPPVADISYEIQSVKRIGRDLQRVGVQFHGQVYDPDSDEHTFAWDFGDSTFSSEQDPAHEFLIEADYTYTVSLLVEDPDHLVGCDTCQIVVEPGPGDLPATINFVGDVMTARGYEEPGGIIETYGVEYIFEPTLPILGQAAQVSVCNLECPYTDRGEPHPTKSVVFRSRPENIAGIHFAGIDLVSIGNNHIIDYGEPGMLQTMDLLDSLAIRYSGAGVNSYFALLPTFWTEAGVRVAFLGQSNRTGRQWNYQPFLDAGYNKPGFGYLLPKNLTRALAEARGVADIVILQTHSGDEYETQPPDLSGGSGPPPVEATSIGPFDPDFRFPIEPSPGDRALRRMALDAGADILINHHPHVLQGFESYNGKLIAHSLGNFVFDLYYPETMPTIVLTLEIVKHGIIGYTFRPAWIDDWIPKPATGRLGREIMDRMADYSRDLDALVAVDLEGNRARVYLARDETDSTISASTVEAELVAGEGYRISPPLEIAGTGHLSRIVDVTGDAPAGWEISWGREILWHGGFEDEGATFWDTNTPDEWLDESEAHSGVRSLVLRRTASDQQPVGTDLEKHLPCDPQKRHSCAGFLKGENASEAVILARFYNHRYSDAPVSSTPLGPPFTGSGDWIFLWSDLDTPGNGVYFEMRCENGPPASGTGYAWFDDLAFIEWEPWVAADDPLSVPSPNNYRFLQVRTQDPSVTTVTVLYEETRYDPGVSQAPEPSGRLGADRWLRCIPNPFAARTTIELILPQASGPLPVDLAVYDVCGRRVAHLFSGRLAGGRRHVFAWDGTDDAGHRLGSGIYFSRVRMGNETRSLKLLYVR